MAHTVTLHFSEHGQGTPVVFLHGYPLSSAIWHTQQQGLSDHYRVITPDLRGHGQSPAPDGVYEMDTLAADVLALLDSLNIPKAVIMGHSMGGYVTFALWRMAAQRFQSLGLICSPARPDSEAARNNRYKTAGESLGDRRERVATRMGPP